MLFPISPSTPVISLTHTSTSLDYATKYSVANMPLSSDITINSAVFELQQIDASTKSSNQIIEGNRGKHPAWYEVGAAAFRQMTKEGKGPLPVPAKLPNARDTAFPSRDIGRDIPVRVYVPDNGKPSRGVFLYLHGGGFVVGTHQE